MKICAYKILININILLFFQRDNLILERFKRC